MLAVKLVEKAPSIKSIVKSQKSSKIKLILSLLFLIKCSFEMFKKFPKKLPYIRDEIHIPNEMGNVESVKKTQPFSVKVKPTNRKRLAKNIFELTNFKLFF